MQFLADVESMEDVLTRLASQGYTLEEVEEIFEIALENTGYYDELDDDDD